MLSRLAPLGRLPSRSIHARHETRSRSFRALSSLSPGTGGTAHIPGLDRNMETWGLACHVTAKPCAGAARRARRARSGATERGDAARVPPFRRKGGGIKESGTSPGSFRYKVRAVARLPARSVADGWQDAGANDTRVTGCGSCLRRAIARGRGRRRGFSAEGGGSRLARRWRRRERGEELAGARCEFGARQERLAGGRRGHVDASGRPCRARERFGRAPGRRRGRRPL